MEVIGLFLGILIGFYLGRLKKFNHIKIDHDKNIIKESREYFKLK